MMNTQLPGTGTSDADMPWRLSISYQRDPKEELEAAEETRKRFAAGLDSAFIYLSLFYAFCVFALMAVTVELSRHFTPIFQGEPGALTYNGEYWAAFLPMAILLAVAAYGYARLLKHKRHGLRLARIRAEGWADIELTTTGFIYITKAGNQRFEWHSVRNIWHSKDKIFLDMDQIAFYIPERAFKDRPDFLIQYKLIRQAWHDRMMQEATQKS